MVAHFAGKVSFVGIRVGKKGMGARGGRRDLRGRGTELTDCEQRKKEGNMK